MTDTDRLLFVQSFNRLAVACRLSPSEADASMQRVYWDALEDLPLASVLASADHLAKSAKWFPKAAEWREAARMAGLAALQKSIGDGRDVPWQDECGACTDTGWEPRTCYPGTRNTCGRKRCESDGREHHYVIPCTCRPNNRTYARHHKVPSGQERYAS